MREIRAVIADDEPLARRGIRQLLAAHPDISVVAECRDGVETLESLERDAPDLLFLDVQMPELDGLGVVRARGADRMPMTVFVTAFERHAVEAFETHALDYLVKPVSEERFSATMRRVRERLQSVDAIELTRQLAAFVHSRAAMIGPTVEEPRPARRLVVPTANGDLVLDLSEIDWIQADDYYAAVHVRGRRHLIRESLTSLEHRLDPSVFLRVHRSAIVPIDRVRELRTNRSGESTIVLRDGTKVPVSRRRKQRVSEIVRLVGR
jgi:two-component system, LytTR family, response regulator